jgi:hypothetical protein
MCTRNGRKKRRRRKKLDLKKRGGDVRHCEQLRVVEKIPVLTSSLVSPALFNIKTNPISIYWLGRNKSFG